jgi:ubiquinone biosynthesis protein
MRGPHNIWRLIRTGATFERTGAMKIALEMLDVPPSIRIAARILGWPFKWLGLKGDVTQPPVLRAITALGPAYIKFGQLMSTRPDVVGTEMALELKVLQDSLPAFSMELAKAEVLKELGQTTDELFSEFSEPVAAASIAQVHYARLRETGQEVAVKILRPNIERAFRKDVDAFYFAAQTIEFLSPASRRLRPTAVIEHFNNIVDGELDLRTEAAAASEFQANTEKDEGFYVPKILWDQSARSVMTLEWAEGIPLGDIEKLQNSGQDLTELGTRIIHMFLRHALRDGFFHADMHQGNLKLAPNGDLIALDFGIMGRIDEYTRRAYAEILMGFIRKDYRRVAEVHFEAGYVPADQDVDAFAQALRSVGEPIFGHGASQVSMARLLAHLFDVTERFGMETRTELILLQRTMVVVEGVARTFDPELNMWATAEPEVARYIKDNLGPRAMLRDLTKVAMVLSRFGPRLPEIIEGILTRSAEEQDQKTALTRIRVLKILPLAIIFTAIGFALAQVL